MSYCFRRHMKTLLRLGKTAQQLKDVNTRLNCIPKMDQMTSMCSTYTENLQEPEHIPVMTQEVLDIMEPVDGEIYATGASGQDSYICLSEDPTTIVDMTFGGGGHSKSILQRALGITLVAADRDPVAFELAKQLEWEMLGKSTILPLLGKFSELHHHMSAHEIEEGTVDSFLFDLGASSMQFDTAGRGFSLSRDGPLDMRMDKSRCPDQPTAAEIINHLKAKDLSIILKNYGEERHARSIAQAIVEARYAFGNITSTAQLAQVIDTVFEGSHKQDKLQRHAHPATKSFQALRIFVNNELNELHNGLELAWKYLRPGGICAVISFHSLEDRIVKRHFHGIEMDAQGNMTVGDHHRNSAITQPMHIIEEMLEKRWMPLSKKVMTPTLDELATNPRARSAKLRAAIKVS